MDQGIKNESSRLLIISNRLPVTIEEKGDSLEYQQSAGGLATGLNSIERGASKWIGWPGAVSKRKQKIASRDLIEKYDCWPVFLPEKLIEKYYEGFSNRTIWPIFHSFQTFAKFSETEWQAYVEANNRFAESLEGKVNPGDTIWIHDYQLLLLPSLLRERYPQATIGFFLHIPFPPFEVFRLMPQHKMILQGMLGADLIGFHTNEYLRSFLNSIHRTLGIEDRMGHLLVGERYVEAIVHPMGIHFDKFSSVSSSLEGHQTDSDLKTSFQDQKVIFSVSRLDYTKGIPQALESYDLFLEKNPDMREKVCFILVVVPSREKVDRYAYIKREIDELVGRINARYGSVNWSPIRYLYRSLSFDELILLYKNSDVALITPLRDGMNLVAKEYVAARNDEKGVLILSELAGAAKELLEALQVNPNSKEEMAAAIKTALTMEESEQNLRMRTLRERLLESPIQNWGDQFVSKMAQVSRLGKAMGKRQISESIKNTLIQQYQEKHNRLLILDYDGTLMPLMSSPKKVVPDEDLIQQLTTLSSDPKNHIIVLSGRRRSELESWLNKTGASLVAEHGAWTKWTPNSNWTQTSGNPDLSWKDEVRENLMLLVEKIPGSFVEEKEYSLVWHYRRSDRELADAAAKDLLYHLLSLVGERPIRIVPGNCSIEIRCIDAGKGKFLKNSISFKNYDFILAAGDDLTDEDMFSVLPSSAVSIKVGSGFSKARYQVKDHLEIRSLLKEMSTEKIEPASTSITKKDFSLAEES